MITVEATSDIRSLSDRKFLVAAKGRRGKIYEWWALQHGIGPNCKENTYIPVMLEGNHVNRDLPNWKLKIVEEQGGCDGLL